MDNKSFKEMIKKHQVKQSFVCIDIDEGTESIYRFYQDTSNPNNLYCNKWYIKDGVLQKEIEQVNKGIWKYYWHKYVNSCLNADKYDLTYFKKMYEESPMEHRKYWKIKLETVLFMLKDQRINRG